MKVDKMKMISEKPINLNFLKEILNVNENNRISKKIEMRMSFTFHNFIPRSDQSASEVNQRNFFVSQRQIPDL